MKVLNNYILVEPAETAKQTAGGIYLPDRIDKDPRWLKVREVGPGLPDMFGNIQELGYRPGEWVYVLPHAIHKANLRDYGLHDEELWFVSEGDVLIRSDEPTSMALRPVGSYVVIKRIEMPKQTAGGIYLPDKSVPPPMLAKVVAVGSGYRTAATGFLNIMARLLGHEISLDYIRESVPLHVSEGDTVLVVATAPMAIKLEQFGLESDLYLVGEADILAVLDRS